MKKAAPKVRAYRQDARAEQTEANAQGIVASTVALIWSVRRIGDITLDEVAADCGLTVRTILRRFGSRDGLLDAAFAQLYRDVERLRVPTPGGDVEAGLTALLNFYEEIGDLNIRGLEQEDQLPALHQLLEGGRASHRDWLEHVFGPHLADSMREQSLTTLYAATDVYLWKLLRRDLHLTPGQAAATFRQLVNGVLNNQSKRKEYANVT